MTTYVLDCGTNKSTLYNSDTDKCDIITHSEVLALPDTLPEGSTLICEYSHLGCQRTEFSLSQPFTADELLRLYSELEDKNITLKLFPQKSTPRACSYANLPKSDESDPKSIYILTRDFPQISMMNPPKTFEEHPKRLEAYDYKNYTSKYINMARRQEDAYSEDGCSKWIIDNIELLFDNLSDTAKSAFSKGTTSQCQGVKTKHRTMKRDKKGKVRMTTVSMQSLYAVICTLIDYDGNVRVRPSTGEMAGWQYIKRYVLCMSPFHFRGGVARSNLYWHGMKNWIKFMVQEDGLSFKGKSRGGFFEDDGKTKIEGSMFTPEDDAAFIKYRKQYADSIRELFQLTKKILNGTLDSKHHSKQLEFTLSS